MGSHPVASSSTSVAFVIVVILTGSSVLAMVPGSSEVDAEADEKSEPDDELLNTLGLLQKTAEVHLNNTNITNSEAGAHVSKHYHVVSYNFTYVATPFIVSTWLVFASVAKIVFHLEHKMSSIFPESCLLIVIGFFLGLILYFTGQTKYELDTSTFFLILMPPIILEAGYFMPTRLFFDNIGTILLFAVVGTMMNTFMLGLALGGLNWLNAFPFENPLSLLQLLVFASLLAAVDPVAVLAVFEEVHVNEILYIVVLGESLINDGICVVLYKMFTSFCDIGLENILCTDVLAGIASFFVIICGSTVIGIFYGIMGSFLSRFMSHIRVLEPLIVFVIGYLSYLSAEMFHLSGIIACIFCGITMKKYVEANISLKSHTTVKYFMKMLASVCEAIIFMYLGISVVCDTHYWNTAFVISTLVFCLVFRSLGVILLTSIANRFRLMQLNHMDQFILAYGGLRGAVAFALVVLLKEEDFPHRNMFITTTTVVIYFTNILMGTTIKPLVNILKVKKSDKRKPTMNEKIANRCIDHLMAGIEDITAQRGHHLLRERFSYINNKYLKPLLIRKMNCQPRGWSIIDVCQKLDERDAKQLLLSGSFSSSVPDGNLVSSNSLARLISSASLRLQLGYPSWHAKPTVDCNSPNGMYKSSHGNHPDSFSRGLPEIGSSTCLDLQVLDSQDSRKMRDDSKIHHIIEDAIFKPKKKFLHHRHQVATTDTTVLLDDYHLYHHNAPVHLRHLMSHSLRHQNSHKDLDPRENNGNGPAKVKSCNGMVNSKSGKNVSFAEVTDIANDFAEMDNTSLVVENDVKSLEEDEDVGITFTALVSSTNSDAESDSPVEAAVEFQPPWKQNQTSIPVSSASHAFPDDLNPVIDEAPTWAENSEEFLDNISEESFYGGAEDGVNLGFVSPDATSCGERQDAEKNVESAVYVGSYGSFQVDVSAPSICTENSNKSAVITKAGSSIQSNNSETCLPPPWKINKMQIANVDVEAETSSYGNEMAADGTNDVAIPSQPPNDEFQIDMDVACHPLPWRNLSSDHVIPDQQAPRPVRHAEQESRTKPENGSVLLSPSASFDKESYSIHPQASCHSFRLSEAESRHSEPIHLHHVIEIASTMMTKPSLNGDYSEENAEELLELETMDSHERVSKWLISTSDEMDDTLDGEEGIS